jgi:hypothetical protein
MKSPPHVMMAFACEKVSSEPGQPTSFHNLLDGIEAAEFPAPTGRWFAVFCFYSPAARTMTNCRVLISHERGEPVAQTAVRDLTFTPSSPISRNVVGFAGFAWPYPGWYRVEFIAGRDAVLASFPMLVRHAPRAEEAAPEDSAG